MHLSSSVTSSAGTAHPRDGPGHHNELGWRWPRAGGSPGQRGGASGVARGRRRLGYRVRDGWWGHSGSHCSAAGWWQKRKEACSVSTQSPGNNKQEEWQGCSRRQWASAGRMCSAPRADLSYLSQTLQGASSPNTSPSLPCWGGRPRASSPEVPRDDLGCRGVAGGTHRDMG